MRDLAKDRSLLAINSATVKPWTLEQLVEGCVRAGITGIGREGGSYALDFYSDLKTLQILDGSVR